KPPGRSPARIELRKGAGAPIVRVWSDVPVARRLTLVGVPVRVSCRGWCGIPDPRHVPCVDIVSRDEPPPSIVRRRGADDEVVADKDGGLLPVVVSCVPRN